MKYPLLLLALSLAAERAPAEACFDPFADATADGGTTYAVGSFLFHQVNGLGTTWYALTNTPAPPATGFPVVAAGNLAYAGLPTPTGNCVSIPPSAGVMGRLTLGFVVTSGTAYYSFLLKVTDLSGVDTSGTQNNFFAGFGDTIGNQNAALLRAATRLYTRKSGTGFNLGVARNSSTPADWVFETTQRSLNTVLFVVGCYDYGNHTAKLWINPSSSTFGSERGPDTDYYRHRGRRPELQRHTSLCAGLPHQCSARLPGGRVAHRHDLGLRHRRTGHCGAAGGPGARRRGSGNLRRQSGGRPTFSMPMEKGRPGPDQ